MNERTTVQVRRDLIPKLEAVKKELGVESYDAAIRRLIQERRRLPKSYFGRFPKLEPFEREELDRLD